jgi:hypothetical protein
LKISSKFQRIVDDMEEEDKFQCLIQAITEGSRARGIVESFPATAENYSKVIERLKNRFGEEELLIECCMRELLGFVIKMPHTAGQSGAQLLCMMAWNHICLLWNQLECPLISTL